MPTNLRFRVTFSPDTIRYIDTSKITVTAVDQNGNPVVIPDNTLLSFTIVTTDNIWGYFYDPAHNFCPSPLQNVTYGDARLGKVTFASNCFIDTLGQLKPVQIRVEGGRRVGLGTVYLGTVTLKFDGADTLAVYPHYVTYDKHGNPISHNNATDKRDTVDLTLRSQYGDSSAIAKNIMVKVTGGAFVDSGGHAHYSGRRPVQRYQFKNGTSWSAIVDSFQQPTDGTGTLQFRVLATELGGVEKIKAVMIWDGAQCGPETHAFKPVNTRVPDLRTFCGTGHFSLTGSNQWHPNNHYIVGQLANDSLISAASEFADAEWNDTGDMRLNDMSLKFGGLFDLDTMWTSGSGHKSHRLGTSVDIENIVKYDTTVIYQGKPRKIYIADKDWLDQYSSMMEKHKWYFTNEDQTDPSRPNPKLKWPHYEWKGL